MSAQKGRVAKKVAPKRKAPTAKPNLSSFMNAKQAGWGEDDNGGIFLPAKGSVQTIAATPRGAVKATKFAARIFTGGCDENGMHALLGVVLAHFKDYTVAIQPGTLKTFKGKKKTSEKGAQVLLLNSRRLKKLEFSNEVAMLAEKVCVGLKRATVVVELQRDGDAIEVFDVLPDD